MKKEMESRGSDALLKSKVIDPDDLKQLHKVLQGIDLKLLDWSCRGQPKPDSLWGMVDVKLDRLPALVGELSRFNDLRLRLDGFPHGMPDPDGFFLRFRN